MSHENAWWRLTYFWCGCIYMLYIYYIYVIYIICTWYITGICRPQRYVRYIPSKNLIDFFCTFFYKVYHYKKGITLLYYVYP
jgi:hypothetical protein